MRKQILLTLIVAVFSCTIYAQTVEQRVSTENNGQGSLWKKETTTGTIYNNTINNNVAIGKQIANAPLDVKGVIKSDSIKVSGTLTADSIHVRSLKVGEHSLYLGGQTTPIGTSDFIQSSAGFINFGNTNMSAFSEIIPIRNQNTL